MTGLLILSLFKAEPRSELSKFINAYKSASSRLLKKEYGDAVSPELTAAFVEQQGKQEKPSKRKITQRIKEMEDAKGKKVQDLPE